MDQQRTNRRKGDKIIDITEESREEWLASWLAEYGRQLLVALAVLLILLLLSYVWHLSSKGKAETDYLAAENAFQQLEKEGLDKSSPAAENPSYLTLKEILARHPELGSRYNGPLAQMFLRLGDQKLAMTYADKALKELATEKLPFYEEFSKTSLLIAEGNYRDAYKRAAFLQKRMREEAARPDPGFRPALLVLNQIRLATLLQKLDIPAEELKAWREIGQLTQNNEASSEILNTIKTGQISFKDYIQVREKDLRI